MDLRPFAVVPLLLSVLALAASASGDEVQAQYKASHELLSKAQAMDFYKAASGKAGPVIDCEAIWDGVQPAADAGNTKAMLDLVSLYDDDASCTKPDKTKRREWLTKAAELGDDAAQVQLADALLGEGGDRKAAGGWYEKAAAQGNVRAKQVLFERKPPAPAPAGAAGQALLKAQDCAKDKSADCLKLWLAAAQAGSVEGEYRFGRENLGRFFQGEFLKVARGQDSDETKYKTDPVVVSAMRWLRKAAEHGHVEAQFELASDYESSDYLAQDLTAAAAWYRKASAQGHPRAQEALEKLLAAHPGLR